jgi:hypothetical protein
MDADVNFIHFLSFFFLGMSFILEKILHYLDCKSLCRVMQVCKSWYEAVNRGNSWKEKLVLKVSPPTFSSTVPIHSYNYIILLDIIQQFLEGN